MTYHVRVMYFAKNPAKFLPAFFDHYDFSTKELAGLGMGSVSLQQSPRYPHLFVNDVEWPDEATFRAAMDADQGKRVTQDMGNLPAAFLILRPEETLPTDDLVDVDLPVLA